MAGGFKGLLRTVHDGLTDISFELSKLCLFAIVFAYLYEVVARYGFNAPTSWGEETVSYALCIGCFLAMPAVTRAGAHIAITFVFEVLTERYIVLANRIILLVSFLVCAAITWISLDENIRQVVNDVQLMNVHAIPKIYITAFITYGFGSSAIYFLRKTLAPRSELEASAQSPLV